MAGTLSLWPHFDFTAHHPVVPYKRSPLSFSWTGRKLGLTLVTVATRSWELCRHGDSITFASWLLIWLCHSHSASCCLVSSDWGTICFFKFVSQFFYTFFNLLFLFLINTSTNTPKNARIPKKITHNIQKPHTQDLLKSQTVARQ